MGRATESMPDTARVAICIVSHNSESDLPGCLASIAALEHDSLEVVLVDCASGDRSVAVAEESAPAGVALRVIPLGENRGFAGGMNAAIAATEAPLLLALNPDARPSPSFVSRLESRLAERSGPRVGAVTGRLVRPADESGGRRLDACGMRLTLTWRHLDRGSNEIDRGQFEAPERVFGATGAATLYLRAALDDVALDGEIFDRTFHTYREDAELCFRLRERRWEVLYEPSAVAEHRRVNLPSRRRTMAARVNRDSLKNRYLLRAYHQSWPNLFATLLPTLWRDLLALGYVVTRERTSLPAYAWLWRRRRFILERRRALRERRTASLWEVERWFFRSGLPL